MLEHPNKILQWNAIIIIGNLAPVDSQNKIDAILDGFLRPIPGPVMITAANTARAAACIAKAKPQLSSDIMDGLLRVESAEYQTPECRNVAIGHVIQAFDEFFPLLADPRSAIGFVQR